MQVLLPRESQYFMSLALPRGIWSWQLRQVLSGRSEIKEVVWIAPQHKNHSTVFIMVAVESGKNYYEGFFPSSSTASASLAAIA